MSMAHKHFIAMQLLLAVHTLHSLRLYHGHIRSSNVLLTSNDHLVLSDLATYKPYFLHQEQLGEYRNIYVTGSSEQGPRSSCTLAPEKFIPGTEQLPKIQELAALPRSLLEQLQQMDMFSVGVVLAELYMPDEVLFDFERLMRYRKGDYDVQLGAVGDAAVESLVANLLARDPSSRHTSQSAL